MGIIKAICKSEKKGTVKRPVDSCVLKPDHGMIGDAHAGNWHRQVSLLAFEKIEEFRSKGAKVEFGDFGENLVVEGYDLRALPVGTRFKVGEDVILELTQIGKNCHSGCEIYKLMGDCIMPREGVFTKVLKGGEVKPGDSIDMLPLDENRPFTAAVVTMSDRSFNKEREDESTPLVSKMLKEAGFEVKEEILLPDTKILIKKELSRLADQRQIELIITTGGTGLGERDVTPEATIEISDKMATGIATALIMNSLKVTDKAMLSRQTAGIRKRSLIVNLPGSPKACRENMEFLLKSITHGLAILRGNQVE